MYDRAYAIATGIFLAAAVAALLITAYWLAGTDPGRRPYVVVSPYSVAGLSVGSQVLYRGVPAGRVERIRIDPQDPGQVLIRIAVEPQVPVLRGTFARLHQRGLTGVAQVELQHDAATEPLATSDAHPAHIPMAPSLIQQATDVGTRTLEILRTVADALEQTLSGANGAKLQSVAARLDDLLTAAERIAAALESDLPRALDRATSAADSVAALAEGANEQLDDVDALIEELRATAGAARTLAEDLSGTGVPALQSALDSVHGAADELGRLADTLAANPSQLLHGRRTPPGPGEE
jgi:phospholipid/cholesterol/gamma-HCH transport system substrate-binding protein